MALDWMAGLGAALESGSSNYMRHYAALKDVRDREKARELDEQRLGQQAKRDSDAASLGRLRLDHERMKETTKEQKDAKARASRSAAFRAILGSSARGKAIIDAIPKDLDLGDERMVTELDNLFKVLEPPVKDPKQWVPTTKEEWEASERYKASLRPKRRGSTDDNDADSTPGRKTLTAINTMIDDARMGIAPKEKALQARQELEANWIPMTGRNGQVTNPLPPMAPSDTAGLGRARADLEGLTSARREMVVAPLTGRKPDLSMLEGLLSPSQPGAGAMAPVTAPVQNGPPPPMVGGVTVRQPDPAQVQALLKQEAREMGRQGMNPQQISQALNQKYGKLILELRGK